MRIQVVIASFVILVTHLASAQTDLIVNGGFEAGTLAPWQFVGTAGANILTDQAHARSGNNYLSMGNFANANQGVYQTITIPTNAVVAGLGFFFNVAVAGGGSDSLRVFVANTNQVALTNVAVISGSSADLVYHFAGFDMKPFIGQTVEVFFTATTVGISSFRIDDVTLISITATDFPTNDYFTNRIVLTTTNSVTVTATNTLATDEPDEPEHAGNSGGKSLWWTWTAPTNGTVTMTTAGSSFDTVLAVYTGDVLSNLTAVAANDNDHSDPRNVVATSRVKFAAAAGVPYQIAVDGAGGAAGKVVLNLNFVPDTKAPTVSITAPASGAKLTNSTVIVQGKASDDVGVALVQIRLENAAGTNEFQSADGTNTWSATITDLIPGLNTVRVRAFDTSSNASVTVLRSFNYLVVSPLTLTINGNGTVTPNLNGQSVALGSTNTVTAKPGPGFVFAGWSGDVTANTAVLKFVMQSNLVLQANFVPNPFIPVVGTFQGLFYDTNGIENQSSGFIAVKLTSTGKFSAKVQPAGSAFGFSGQFSAAGAFSNTIPRTGLAPLSVQVQLDFVNGVLTGQLSDGTWTAQLLANRAGYSKLNPAPQTGKYTMLLPGGDDASVFPAGDGIGAVSVDSSGNVKLSGTLADGTRLTQKAVLSGKGEWPFFVPLYNGQGSALGWLTFTNETASDFRGSVTWIKLSQPAAVFYPAGFTNELEASGSSYRFTNGVPVLDVSTGQVWLANGNLPSAFTNVVALSTANKVSNLSTNPLSLTITASSGLFKGSATDPTSGRVIPFNGVILQKVNAGRGFFLGTNQTGRVFFGP